MADDKVIRYYAKVNARGKTSFGGKVDTREHVSWAHFGSPEAAGSALRLSYVRCPEAKLINGPEPGWDKEYHSDGFGEFELRKLTNREEKGLLAAIKGEEVEIGAQNR
jgi:hypothetical protein